MKRILNIFFYAVLCAIIIAILFSLLWMYDNGKRMAADPNLIGEWIAVGFLGMFVYWCYAGIFLMIIAVMRRMELTKKFFNILSLTLIRVVSK